MTNTPPPTDPHDSDPLPPDEFESLLDLPAGRSVAITDEQWTMIRSVLPAPARTGRPRADDRTMLEAILFVLETGCRWRDLPPHYGSPTTAWRRLRAWQRQGLWDYILEVVALKAQLDGTRGTDTSLLRLPALDLATIETLARKGSSDSSEPPGEGGAAPGGGRDPIQ